MICDSDKKFEKRSAEYENYLIARDCKPGKVKKQFLDIKKLTKVEARKPKLFKTTFQDYTRQVAISNLSAFF